jgi:hypothetical protein
MCLVSILVMRIFCFGGVESTTNSPPTHPETKNFWRLWLYLHLRRHDFLRLRLWAVSGGNSQCRSGFELHGEQIVPPGSWGPGVLDDIWWHTETWNQEALPSGNLLHNYGKSPFLMGKSTISMAIFNSYVNLPEGTFEPFLMTLKVNGRGPRSMESMIKQAFCFVHVCVFVGGWSPKLDDQFNQFPLIFRILYFLHFPAPCYIPAMSKNMPKTGKNSGCPPGQTPNTEATTSAYAASEALRPWFLRSWPPSEGSEELGTPWYLAVGSCMMVQVSKVIIQKPHHLLICIYYIYILYIYDCIYILSVCLYLAIYYICVHVYIYNICIYMYYLLHTKYSVCCHVWKHHVGEASFPIGVAVNPGMPRPSNFSVVNSFIFAG